MSEKQKTTTTRVDEIRGLLKDLLKVIKIVSMYPENNPLPQSLRRTFAERLENYLQDHGELAITVFKDYLCWNDETVFTDRSKEENLAGLFFDTGITSLTFGSDFGVEQAYAFFDVLKAYMNEKGQKGDLVQTLWEKSIPNLSFTTVEDVQLAAYQGDFRVEEIHTRKPTRREGQFGVDTTDPYEAIFTQDTPVEDNDDRLPDEGAIEPGASGGNRQNRAQMFYAVNTGQGEVIPPEGSVDEVTFHAAEAAMGLGFGNLKSSGLPVPNTTMILNDELKLTEEDEACIADMCARDTEYDMFESTLELLKEMLLQESELPDFGESVTICEKLHADFMRAGKLGHAGALYVHLRQLEETLRPDRPGWADRLKDARITAASRERLHLLATTLNKIPEITPIELRHYLDLFGWEALGFLADLLGDLEHRVHRECLVNYLADRGRENLPLVAKGMYDKRWFVVRNTVTVLTRIGTDMAIGYLKRAAEHDDQRVRMELATVLRECPNPNAVKILRLLVTDPEPVVRSAVIGALLSQPGPEALETVQGIIQDAHFSALDREERQSVLNAYAILGGEDASRYLLALGTKVSFWRDDEVEEDRRAALTALAHSREPQSEEALIRLSRSWRPAVKQAALMALKKRREVMLADSGH